MASSSPVGVAAGLMQQPAAGMACLPLAGDAEQVEADLREHALTLTGTMPTHPVPGDGHCFFRSVAFQTQAGEGAHGELRAAVVRAVAADAEAYVHFLVDCNIGGWLAGMVGSEWADDLAVQACVNLLRRPVLIWRLGLEQEPTLKVPWFWGPTEAVKPIYLLLDETEPGCEHYNVLVQRAGISEGRVAVEEGLEPAWETQPPPETYLSKPTPKRVAQTSAEAESGNAKRRRFNAPRPKPKPVGKNNKSKDKHEMPTPMIRHRRYTCKTTPPPELRDDILTEMAKVPVTPAGTLRPHRKVEDMIKAGTPTYIMHELCKVGSLVTRRAHLKHVQCIWHFHMQTPSIPSTTTLSVNPAFRRYARSSLLGSCGTIPPCHQKRNSQTQTPADSGPKPSAPSLDALGFHRKEMKKPYTNTSSKNAPWTWNPSERRCCSRLAGHQTQS